MQELIRQIKKNKITSQDALHKLKLKIAKEYKLNKIPTNADLAASASAKDRVLLKNLLTIKPTRVSSGVAVVAIMSKPMPCPHGKCITCPGGPDSIFGNVPQSYTGKEPATRRAERNFYNPYLQVFNRLEQYVAMNRTPQKIELIIMGGTFPSYPKKYQKCFIAYSFKALNDFGKTFFKNKKLNAKKFNEFFELPGDLNSTERVKRIQKRILKLEGKANLEKEQFKNEKAFIRCVGLTLETRPDYADGDWMLKLGATRVELGIQSVYNKALKFMQRGHSVKDSIKAIKDLKDLGFKLNFHYMPGLVKYKEDLEGMKQLFSNPDFRPDMLKIYPCMVLKGTKLYELWKKKKYKPLTTKKATQLIKSFKKHVPEYCRIMRIQRDIPTYMTEAGVDRTNLRQLLGKTDCRCIRCREPGNKTIEDPSLVVTAYEASGGFEFFISIEDQKNDIIAGFCRLRFPSKSNRKEITKNSAIIRELHVYGEAEQIGKSGKLQHKGYGKLLLKKAEEIAKQNKKDKIIIISGIGVREYYKKLLYKKEGPYMVKKI